MRTFRRLRLRCLLLTSTPLVLPFSLSHHVETMSSPTKHTVFTLGTSTLGNASQYTWVEMPGIEPGSTMPLLQRNYNNIYIIYLLSFGVNPPNFQSFWVWFATLTTRLQIFLPRLL
jgi:hypothetical protein